MSSGFFVMPKAYAPLKSIAILAKFKLHHYPILKPIDW
jgi:hypothetical protein